MKAEVFRRLTRPALVVLALFALLLASWLAHLAYLTAREDRACEGVVPVIATDEALQRVLDAYSTSTEGVGLQATVVYPDGAVWNGVSGYASRREACSLTPDHHLYVGSITKLYTAALVMDQFEKQYTIVILSNLSVIEQAQLLAQVQDVVLHQGGISNVQ